MYMYVREPLQLILVRVGAREILVDELEESRGISLTLVLHHAAIRGLHQKGGKSLYRLSRCLVRLLLRADHANFAGFSVYSDGAALYELLKLGLHLLAVPAPLGVVHCEGVCVRILEALFGARESRSGDIGEGGEYGNRQEN